MLRSEVVMLQKLASAIALCLFLTFIQVPVLSLAPSDEIDLMIAGLKFKEEKEKSWKN